MAWAPILEAFDPDTAGESMLDLMEQLFPMQRSITGAGFRDTQTVLAGKLPSLKIEAVPSGSQAFDWTIPDEWNIREARIVGPDGTTVVDLADNPLHILNYSTPVDARITLEELKAHLHSDPDQPEAIPYRTSYYEDAWGFCLPHRVVESLPEGEYHVVIDSDKTAGVLNYGELLIPGETDREVLITAHACHPGQCNDNLSGVVVAAAVAEALLAAPTRLSFRVLFLPGGVGSVAWLYRNRDRVHRVVGGLTLSCVGDEAPFRYKETYRGDTVVDRAAMLALRDGGWEHSRTPFEPYGFDERNFNSPAFRLAVGSLTRSPHGGFPGYHTSEDNLDTMSARRLGESLQVVLTVASILDRERRYVSLSPEGEPQLGKRGLYASIGGVKERRETEIALLWVMNMSDGTNTLTDIASRSGIAFDVVFRAGQLLAEHGLVEETIGEGE